MEAYRWDDLSVARLLRGRILSLILGVTFLIISIIDRTSEFVASIFGAMNYLRKVVACYQDWYIIFLIKLIFPWTIDVVDNVFWIHELFKECCGTLSKMLNQVRFVSRNGMIAKYKLRMGGSIGINILSTEVNCAVVCIGRLLLDTIEVKSTWFHFTGEGVSFRR